MRILLIEPYNYINRTRNLIPVGMPYLAAMLSLEKLDIEGINPNYLGMTETQSIDHILSLVRTRDYDMVAMGGLCNAFRYQKKLFKKIRGLDSRLTLVSGGNMFSSEPALCMRAFDVDYGVVGEGEISFPALIKTLSTDGDISKIPGLYYRQKNRICKTDLPGEIVGNLDEIPFPFYELFYSPDIIRNQVQLTVYTSRSCPFHCTFCYHPKGNPYRRRSVPNVIAEIRHLYATYGLDSYVFGDELFLVEKSWVLSFCDELEKLPFLKAWSCQTRANLCDPQLLQRVSQAGCSHVRIGFESGSPIVLRSMRKRTRLGDNQMAVKKVREAKMVVDGGIIIGDFAETEQTITQTIDFVKKSNLVPNKGINFVTPLPGSNIFARCVDQGLIKDKINYLENTLYQPGKLRVNMTRMSDGQLLSQQESAAEEIYSHLLSACRGEIQRIVDAEQTYSLVSIQCPTCKEGQFVRANGFSFDQHYYCQACFNPIFINPLDLPHFKNRTRRFFEQLSAFKEDGPKDILVTPSCFDFTLLRIIADLPVQRIAAFLDRSLEKARNEYFGIPVFPRRKSIGLEFKARRLFIVNVEFCEDIQTELMRWGIENLKIISIFD